MANFKRDDNSVRSETFSSGPIKTTGLHKGHFTKAYKRKSQVPGAQSEAIHFDFISTGGGYGSVDIWYQDKAGNKLDRGIAQIHGLMALLELNELNEKKNDQIDMYDFDLRATKKVRVDSYPALIEKYIGTVWQAEEYIKQEEITKGVWQDTNPPIIKERAVFLRFCDADTHASASEFLSKADPVAIDTYIDTLPVMKRVAVSNKAAQDGNVVDFARNQPATATYIPDFDDENIPF